MHRLYEKARRRLAAEPRLIAMALALLVLLGVLLSMVLSLRLVTVTDDHGFTQTLLTASREPEEILGVVGLEADGKDQIVRTVTSDFQESIHVRRAFPVSVKVDGETRETEVLDGTVADLLEILGVALGPDDLVEPGPATQLLAHMAVQVNRVTFEEVQAREEVPEDLVEEYAARRAAEGLAFQRSMSGMYDATYINKYVDGELASVTVVELVPVLQPRDAGSTEFYPGVPCSTIEGFEGIELGPDGLPTSYTRLLEGADTAAYSSSGGSGASGLGLYCGTVAVNPNVIPYGTRLYITSADGSFIYGFAIATDTGTALMEGRLVIDLYFETNAECLAFGRRAMDVYILD